MNSNLHRPSEPLPDQELLDRYYPSGAPIIIQVAFKYGYGPAIVELNKKVYFNEQLSFSPEIREALQGIVLSHCENKYCLVMHMRGLIAAGFTLNEVEALVTRFELPERLPNATKWSATLQRISALCAEPRVAPRLYASLADLHPRSVIDEIGGVVAFSLLHKVLLDLYPSQILIEDEPILFATIDCGEELIQSMTRRGDEEYPLVQLCCVCKAIEARSGWVPIEQALGELERETCFSHGFCPRCLAEQKAQWESELQQP